MRIIFFTFLFITSFFYAQENHPKDYFVSPLEVPLHLSGSFGELRNNHFHSGLDFKTQQKKDSGFWHLLTDTSHGLKFLLGDTEKLFISRTPTDIQAFMLTCRNTLPKLKNM